MREREPARSDRAHRSVDTAHDAEKDPAPAHGLLDLQRSIGNRATLALLRSAQPKLLVGAANDPCEQEAETAARQVLTRLDATPGAGRAGVELETTPEPAIERLVMRRAAGGPVVGLAGGQVDRDTESAVEGARRGGRALEPPVRERMEGAFGADFSKVQVHSGAESASLNREMGARAFTIGSDIFLGEGTPSLSSRAGEGLLAHELTHTIQQGATSQTAERMVQRFPATALSDPPIPAVDWEKDVGSVSKSSEGASGGVYFVKTKNPKDPIQSLVLKPNFGVNANEAVELAPQLVLGDRVISSLFGIGAPTSRIVAKGTAEFAEIINLISSKDVPSDDPLIRQGWRPVSEAGAIIVMGAVPNATSLSSLAEQAMDDPAANERLHAALFSDTFLYDLGKLMVADMLIGNDDRMVLGAMNVGNMMVSSTSGGHKLYAIDSRAVLGNFDPSEVVRSGGTRLGGKYSTKNELGMDLGERLDDFFKSVMNWFHGGSLKIRRGQGRVAPEGTLDPADILWMEYGARKPAAVKSFTSGFNDGMATVVALSDTKEGQDKMKGITDSFEGQEGSKEVQYLTLKTHAQYMSKRAKGESQDTAGTDTASIAALEMLASFNPNDYRLPEDEFFWNCARPPGGDAYSAAMEDIDVFPKPVDMLLDAFLPKDNGFFSEKALADLAGKISDAKSEIDALGTKSKGRSKKEQPRNRVVAGRFVAETYLLGAGGVRSAGYAKKHFDLAKMLEIATSGKMDPALAARAIPAAQYLLASQQQLQRHLGEYSTNLTAATKAVRKLRKFQQRDDLAKTLEAVARYVPRCGEKFLGASQVVNANLYLNLLKSAK